MLLWVIFVALATGTAAVLWHLTEPGDTRRRLSEVVGGNPAPVAPRE